MNDNPKYIKIKGKNLVQHKYICEDECTCTCFKINQGISKIITLVLSQMKISSKQCPWKSLPITWSVFLIVYNVYRC